MKARVIATNKIIDVEKVSDDYYIDEEKNPYKLSELDFNVGDESFALEIEGEPDMLADIMKRIGIISDGCQRVVEEREEKVRREMQSKFYRVLRGKLMLMLVEKSNTIVRSDLLQLVDDVNSIIDKLIKTEQ